MTTLLYEADHEVWLDRQRRMRRALSFGPGGVLSPKVMAGIIREAEPIPFVAGTRYRIVTSGGEPQLKHVHGVDEAGTVHGLDVIDIDWSVQEIEAVYRGRFTSGPWGPGEASGLPGLHRFELDSGLDAALHDMDVLRAEEVAT